MLDVTSTEAARAVRRYREMCTRSLPALAWRGIALRLWIATHGVTGDRATQLRDLADDAHERANAAEGIW